MKIGVVTLFPEAFEYLLDSKKSGLVGESLKLNKDFFIEDLREHGEGKHKVVDSPPYGGGDGMLFKPEPLEEAFLSLSKKMGTSLDQAQKVFLDPKGRSWSQLRAEELSEKDLKEELNLILLCGRYGGVDQRFLDTYIDESVSVGRFILNGGELPALCVIESLVRLKPSTLGNSDSVLYDSFSKGLKGGLEPEVFTRPQVWKDREIPPVLLSGHHENIGKYRQERSSKLTRMWFKQELSDLKEQFGAFEGLVSEPKGEQD